MKGIWVIVRETGRGRVATEHRNTQRARVPRAAECSPRRKPGVSVVFDHLSPARGDRNSFARETRYFCRPLRGLMDFLVRRIPGLTPGATLWRHLRWLVERSVRRRTKASAFVPCYKSFRFSLIFIIGFLFMLSLAYVSGFSSAPPPQSNDLDYSKFLHTSQRHASQACSACHHRTDNSARPSFPGHKDCTGCHLTQFTTPNIPMCSICHTNVNGNNPPLKALSDRFKESFNMKFDHAQHMTGGARPKNGCSSCHSSPLRRGVALSIPAGLSAHNGCYACHTPNAQSNGRDIASCGTCHDAKPYSRTSTNAVAFSYAFSHAQHSARQRLGCVDCHNYTAGLPQRRQVSSPRAAEHFPTGNNTCATCHNGKRSFGGDLDFKNCKRCHTGQTFRTGM
jgi:c(7)-type cytochrome triheme protein